MANTVDQKIRLLVLYEILQSRTDENHPMTTNEIMGALSERNISASRQTIYQDIELLNEYGYEVLCNHSRSNRYYVADRRFEKTEIQILLSAVGAMQSLSDKKTTALIKKLSELLGISDAEELQRRMFNTGVKHSNERVYYTIDSIMTALRDSKKLSFLYFDYALNGVREYRKDKARYTVNPLGLVYADDKLYLVSYHDKYGNAANYRIDRMDDVRVETEDMTYIKEMENFDLNAYRREQFGMYAGAVEAVELSFPKELSEVIIDKFGEGIKYNTIDNNKYSVKVNVQIGRTFFAWLTTFEGQIIITEPISTRDKFAEFVKKLSENI